MPAHFSFSGKHCSKGMLRGIVVGFAVKVNASFPLPAH